MRNLIQAALLGAGMLVAAGAAAQAVPAAGATPPSRAAGAAATRAPATPPYINGDAAALMAVLPPAPVAGDARDAADRRIFRETRALAGSPRWQMAIEDAQLGNATMLGHFACGLGIRLTPGQAPRLVALAQKATREAAQSMGRAKEFYKRPRPYTVDEGATCVAPASVGESFDYPSGHTTAGWAWGLVLAQVDPDHALSLLARGRAIGDSRVVCGMHNASAVEGARLLTGAAVAVMSGSQLFQSDLAAARAELAALRAAAHEKPDPRQCALEQELVKPYW